MKEPLTSRASLAHLEPHGTTVGHGRAFAADTLGTHSPDNAASGDPAQHAVARQRKNLFQLLCDGDSADGEQVV